MIVDGWTSAVILAVIGALAASILQAESAFLEKCNLFVKERSTNLFRLRIAMQSNLFKSSGS